MKYSLKPIDDLINENWGGQSEVENIVKEIRDTAFSLRTEEETKLFLQKHQFALNKSKSKNAAHDNCDKILFYLETYFLKYLDGRSLVSDLGKEALHQQCQQAINDAEQILPNILSKKLWHFVNVLLNPLKVHCTIDRGNYILQFWENWKTDFIQFYEVHDEDNFIAFAITQNFNSPGFYGYVLDHITKELDNEDNPFLQKQILEIYLRKYCSGPKRLDVQHTPSLDNVCNLLENWLLLGIKHCKKRQKEYNPSQTKLLQKPDQDLPKIETSLSVPQLAYFFRILNKAGIITNEVNREMLEIVSKTFKTKKTDNIALESLYNKFFNAEDGTKESVKQVVKQLLKYWD